MKRFPNRADHVLYSLFFWGGAFLWMAVLAGVTILLLPFVPYIRSHRWVAAPGFARIVKTLTRFRVTYHPHFDLARPSVFCQNHVNLLDAFTGAAVIPRPFCGLMDAWQFKIPFYGWLMKISHGIPVQRGNGKRNLAAAIDEAKKRRDLGMSILTFPEGHRTLDGKLRFFKRGTFRMAREAGYPVVPIAVRGMFDVNRKGTWLLTPGPVDVYVGPQFETADLTDDELERVITEVRTLMVDFVEHGVEPRLKEEKAA